MTSPRDPPAPAQSAGGQLLLVDDHALVRAAMLRLLQTSLPGWQFTEAADGEQALRAVGQARFDVAVVDLSMPGMNGFELIGHLRRQGHAMPVLVLSMHDEEPYALRALRVGAQGYLMKDRAGTELTQALRTVIQGGIHLSPALAGRLLSHLGGEIGIAHHASLSARELEVLRGLSSGETAAEVARALGLPEAAVATSRERIQAKLDLPTLAALVRYGVEHGLASPSSP